MSSIAVTCPGTIRTFTRRATLRRWQKSPRFIAMKQEHALIPGAVCAHCGRKHGEQRYERNGDPKLTPKGKPAITSLTINHMSELLYLTEDLYLTWDPALMEVCCTTCNGWDRQGKEVCPVCKINPIRKDDPMGMCTACYLDAHPEVREQIKAGKEARLESKRQYNAAQAAKRKAASRKHPCKNRRISGICKLSLIERRCPFSPTKAGKNCTEFVARVTG